MDAIAKFISYCVILFALIALALLPFVYETAFGQSSHLQLKGQSYEPYVVAYTSARQFNQDRWNFANLDAETNCMALNLYFEARGQGTKGQLAVGLVTINRVLSKRYPNSICKVVWQKNKNKNGHMVAQFSWTLDGQPFKPLNLQAWYYSVNLAESLLDEGSLFNIADFTKGSTHYHANYVDPYWNNHLTPTIIVGDHLFYSNSPVAKR